jgi:hypothetical protein
VVAEGLELGNGPTRFSSLVAASGHGGLKRKSPVYQRALPRESLAWPGMPELIPRGGPGHAGLITGAIKWGDANFAFPQLRRLRGQHPLAAPVVSGIER